MATTAFGDPQYAEPEPELPGGAQGQAVVVDPNDPSLTSEQVDIDVTQDAYAMPPPPPDGKWRAKLKQVDIKDSDGQLKKHGTFVRAKMNDGKAFFAVNVEASLIDVNGKYDGVKQTEYWVKALVDQRRSIDQMSTITKAAGGVPVARGTQADRLAALEKTLAGEPEAIVETVWEASCQACQDKAKAIREKGGDARDPRPFLIGMHRFPQVGGKPDPTVQCPVCKSMARAQMRIAGFYNVKEMKATRGIAT